MRVVVMQSMHEFVKLFRRFAGNTEKQAIFVTEERNQGLGSYHNQSLKDTHNVYTAYVEMSDDTLQMHYAAQPDLPHGWFYTEGRRIHRNFDNKTEMLRFLKDELKADQEKLATFGKVTVSRLQDMIDSSTEDNDEMTLRESKPKAQKTTVPVNFARFQEVLITITKDRNTLQYNVSADYSPQWKGIEAETASQLNELRDIPRFLVESLNDNNR